MFLVLGFAAGFLAAVPPGPIGILVISQGLKHHFLLGFLVGLTAAVMDVLFCFGALSGLSIFSAVINRYTDPLRAFSAFILGIVGIYLIRQGKGHIHEPKPLLPVSYHKPMASALMLYISNPTIYAFWLTVASTAVMQRWINPKNSQALLFSLSCGLGAAVWYSILSFGISRARLRLNPKIFRMIFRLAGMILLLLALYTAGRILF